MITKNMIDAGKKAYWGHWCPNTDDADCFSNQVTAIYEAMSDQKQKDALIEYRKSYPDNTEGGLRHSNI